MKIENKKDTILYDAVSKNLQWAGVSDTNIIQSAYDCFVKARISNSDFNTQVKVTIDLYHDFNTVSDNVLDMIKHGLSNGPYVYPSKTYLISGNTVYQEGSDFDNFSQAKQWIENTIQDTGYVAFSIANEKLGIFKKEVYTALHCDNQYNFVQTGIYLSNVPFVKTCATCGKSKPESDFYEGRSVCKLCYNSNRSNQNKASQVTREDLPKLFKKYIKREKQLMTEFKQNLQTLHNELKAEISEILDDSLEDTNDN